MTESDMQIYIRSDLELTRSDTGDGGWSLHLRETDDEDGISPVVLSGPSHINAHAEWMRPDDADYEEALRLANTMSDN